MEAGAITQDMFEVFNGGDAYGVSSAPLWTYVAKYGLKPPKVDAVEKFRKTLEEAEATTGTEEKSVKWSVAQLPRGLPDSALSFGR